MQTKKVITLVSDGENRPALTADERASLIALADAFKSSGGIIVCVGVRASGEGFALLQQLASGGFFLNVWGDGQQLIDDAILALTGMMGYYCGGTVPQFGYGYTCQGGQGTTGTNVLADQTFVITGEPPPDYPSTKFYTVYTAVADTDVSLKLHFSYEVGAGADPDFFQPVITWTDPVTGAQAASPAPGVDLSGGQTFLESEGTIAISIKAGTDVILQMAQGAIDVTYPVTITSQVTITSTDGTTIGGTGCGQSAVFTPPFISPGSADIGYAKASSEDTGSPASKAYKAFGPPVTQDGWKSLDSGVVDPLAEWIAYYLDPHPHICTKYQCTFGNPVPGLSYQMIFEGSNDSDPDTATWTTIDSQTLTGDDIAALPGGHTVDREFANQTAYPAYRLRFIVTGGLNLLWITFLQFFDCADFHCLDEPPGPQLPDPNPLPDIEGDGSGTQTWTATKPFTANCEGGLSGDPVTREATRTSTVSQADADAQALAAATAEAEAALVCCNAASQAITINDLAKATPFPSCLLVTHVGRIANVKVHINGWTHTSPVDVQMILVSPAGIAVNLIQRCGGATDIAGVNLIIQDGSPIIPDPIVNGTYKPTQNGGSNFQMDAPAPPLPYATVLSALAGTSPTGLWKLYVQDRTVLDTGSITGWTLDITLAP